MAMGSIFLGLALLVLLGLYLARPIIKSPAQTNVFADQRRQLQQEKDAYVAGINGLDFDYETGKLPTEVYKKQRAQLVADAALLLEELDQLPADDGDDYSQIEVAVAARRRGHAASDNGQAGFCSQCGQPLDPEDKFCSRCGQPIRIAAPTP